MPGSCGGDRLPTWKGVAVPLPTRRVRFAYPEDLEPAWNPRRPEFAFAANSVSLIMPHAEPYFVRVTRAALPELEPEHAGRSRGLHPPGGPAPRAAPALQRPARRRGAPASARLERWMAKAYGWVERRRSLRFNLAFAAASETIAYSLARWTERRSGELFDGAEPVPTSLFLWHLAEEVEHKSAAFDVWKAVDGDAPPLRAGRHHLVVLLAAFTWLGTMVMLRRRPPAGQPGQPRPPRGVGGEPRVHDPARPRGVGPQAPPPEPVRRPDPAVDLAAEPTTRPPRRSRSGRPAAETSAHRPEALPQVLHEALRLLEGGEVAALVGLAPVAQVGEPALGPAARGAEDLLREDRAADRHLDLGEPCDAR